MTISQTLSPWLSEALAHLDAARLSESCSETQSDRSDGAVPCNMPRRMIAVTVALSEPADATPLDWADTIGAALRLIYRDTTVQIIDTWRTDR